jgi:hypothetical protein
MPTGVFYEARPTFRDLSGRFTAANKQLLDDQRDWVRDEGKRFVKIAQRRAPEDTGEFKRSIRYRTFGTGSSLGFTTSAAEPLATWIVGGTDPHTITPRGSGYPLRFEVGGQVVYAYRVNHPGTEPNPFISEAYNEWLRGAEVTFNRISTRWTVGIRR